MLATQVPAPPREQSRAGLNPLPKSGDLRLCGRGVGAYVRGLDLSNCPPP